jgi:hypothetical protein
MTDDLPAELRRIAETGDPLTEWRRGQLGRAVRLHLPLADVIALRQIAVILAELSKELDALSRARGAQTQQILVLAREEMRKASGRLESVQNVYRRKRAKPVGYSSAAPSRY